MRHACVDSIVTKRNTQRQPVLHRTLPLCALSAHCCHRLLQPDHSKLSLRRCRPDTVIHAVQGTEGDGGSGGDDDGYGGGQDLPEWSEDEENRWDRGASAFLAAAIGIFVVLFLQLSSRSTRRTAALNKTAQSPERQDNARTSATEPSEKLRYVLKLCSQPPYSCKTGLALVATARRFVAAAGTILPR